MDITPPSSQVQARHQLTSVISHFGHTNVLGDRIFGRISNLTASAIRSFLPLPPSVPPPICSCFTSPLLFRGPSSPIKHEQDDSHYPPSLPLCPRPRSSPLFRRIHSPHCHAMPPALTAVVRVRGRGSADIASRAAWNPSISQPSFASITGCF
ncbi:hypothetical protein LZ32DRAFT_459578 [Colletotrichum eremochloae]|nr:hypothetical protein LZ32DRAFT_459578 [Colletotrichum eremochloae]